MAHRDSFTTAICVLLGASTPLFPAEAAGAPAWTSPQRYRVLLEVDPRGRARSNSPASVEIDFAAALRGLGASGAADESTIEVIGYDGSGAPRVFDGGRPPDERCLLPADLWGKDEDYLWYSTGGAACYTDLAKGDLGEGTRWKPPPRSLDFARDDSRVRGHFFRSSVSTSLATAFSVSNTPIPFMATASNVGSPL